MATKTTEQRKQEALDRQTILANQNVLSSSTQQLSLLDSQNVLNEARKNQPVEQITSGRTRSTVEDESNVSQLNKIQSASVGSTVTIDGSITPEDKINSVSSSSTVHKNAADIVRARQRLQQSCNHSYSSINQKCIYCDKSRSSHLFD